MNIFRPIAFGILLSLTLGPSCNSRSSTTDTNQNLEELELNIDSESSTTDSNQNAQCRKFKSDLISDVLKAHQINVVEHSYRSDFHDSQGKIIRNPPHIEYKRTELTPEQKVGFHVVLEKMAESPKKWVSFCVFQPHHSIELISDNGRKSVIQICFECGDTEWDGSDGSVPEEFQKVVQQFIVPLGFQVSRDWQELAKQPAQQAASSNH